MSSLAEIRVGMRRHVLRKLMPGPGWSRSFMTCKPVLLGLIDDGFVERVAPPGGRARNMLQLTAKGRLAALASKTPGADTPGAPNPGAPAGSLPARNRITSTGG